MSENDENTSTNLPEKTKTTFSNVLFCQQPGDIQFTVIEEEREQNI